MQFDKHMQRAMELVNVLGTTHPSGTVNMPRDVAKHITWEAQRELALSEVCGLKTGK